MSREETFKKIDQEVKAHPIVMYIKGTKNAPMCGFSQSTIELFKSIGRPFETIDVLSNPDRRAFVPEYSSWPTFPQVFIGGKLVGGCDIVHEMHEEGQLAPLIDEAFKQNAGRG